MFDRETAIGARLQAAVIPVLLFLLFATLPFNRIIALRRGVLVLVIIAAVIAVWRSRRAPPVPPFVWAWFALAPISILWSVRPAFTSAELLPDVVYPLLGFLAALVLVDRPSRVRVALAGLFTGLIAVASVGLWLSSTVVGYDWYELAHGFGKLSTYLIALLPFVLIVVLESARQAKPPLALAGIALLALIFTAGYATGNRMFWLASIGVIAVIALNAARRIEYQSLRRRTLGAAALGMVALAALFVVVARGKPSNAVHEAAGTGLETLLTSNERFEMWRFWIDRVMEHPLLGIGFGHDLPMRHYLPIKPPHWFDLMFAHAHNVFIDVAVQLGLVGLGVFIAALASLAWQYLRAVRRPEARAALAGNVGLALMVGVLAKNVTDDFFSRAPLFDFWLLNGLVLAIIHRAVADPPGRRD